MNIYLARTILGVIVTACIAFAAYVMSLIWPAL